ncbi:MAG: methyltransferase [Actinomycetota bacterium]|nr:methyltransferase [Actinomycetota bacterium]
MPGMDFMIPPREDPLRLLGYRESIFAPDLLIAASAWLDLFTRLSNEAADLEGICAALGLSRRPADVMLTLLTAMGLLAREDGMFRVTELAAEFLVEGSPWNLGPYLASLKERPVCREMLEVLRTGKPARWGAREDEDEWVVAMERGDFARSFTAAMDGRGAYLASLMARSLDCEGRSRLLDIAGGSGIYACAVAAAHPHMSAAVLEKPPVDSAARSAISERGMSEGVSAIAGDMLSGELPAGFDVHLLSHVLHDWDVPAVEKILESSHESLAPGGMVAVYDAHVDADKAGPLEVAEYSVLLMFSTEGKCYSVEEMEEMLAGAGFEDMRYVPTAAHRSLITARKA